LQQKCLTSGHFLFVEYGKSVVNPHQFAFSSIEPHTFARLVNVWRSP
jgi:hypothetical protein